MIGPDIDIQVESEVISTMSARIISNYYYDYYFLFSDWRKLIYIYIYMHIYADLIGKQRDIFFF